MHIIEKSLKSNIYKEFIYFIKRGKRNNPIEKIGEDLKVHIIKSPVEYKMLVGM